MTEHGDSKITIPLFLNLSYTWKSLVSFTLRKHYIRRKSGQYDYLEGCVGPKVGLDVFREEKNRIRRMK